MRKVLGFGLMVVLSSQLPLVAEAGSAAESITSSALKGHVYFLASDELGGRAIGSPGYQVAVWYAASQFRAAGLSTPEPTTVQAGYLQTVPAIKRTARSTLALEIETPMGSHAFDDGKDFIWWQGELLAWQERPLQVVYAGYGISEPEHGWDDLAGLEVKDKVVLIHLGAPVRDGKPVLPDHLHALYAPPSAVFRKLLTLFLRGAAGVLLVPEPALTQAWDSFTSKTSAPAWEYRDQEPGALHVPFLGLVTPAVAQALFNGQDAGPAADGEAGGQATTPFELAGVTMKLTGDFSDEEIASWNVVGVVEGTDPELRQTYVAVTAHLDSSSPEEPGQVNNGADDDASGCAAVFEVARAVASHPPRRSVVFVLFSGEEAAIVGSRHFVSHCPVPVERIVADVNLDMIGRTDAASLTDRSHYAIDSEKITPAFTGLIREVNERTVGWPLKYESPVGNSDNLSFHARGIPAVSFYSGHHEDVNSPTDDAHKLDYEKAEAISRLVFELVMELGNRPVLWDTL